MLYVKTEVKESRSAQKGLFAEEFVKKGCLVALSAQGARVLTEEEYQMAQRQGDQVVIKSAIRWVENYFLCGDSIGPEDYINHSNKPNVLYHCGIMIASRDIQAGEELTADYRHFLASEDVEAFYDAEGDRLVDGINARTSLLETARHLVAILEDIAETDTF